MNTTFLLNQQKSPLCVFHIRTFTHF